MKDEKGLYYYPKPSDVKVRVYVRRGDGGSVEFRLWQMEHPEVWDRHEWLPAEVIEQAAAMYKQLGRGAPGADPMLLYDVKVGEALLAEAGL